MLHFTVFSCTQRAVGSQGCDKVHWRIQTWSRVPTRESEETTGAAGEGEGGEEEAGCCGPRKQKNPSQQRGTHATRKGRPYHKRLCFLVPRPSDFREVTVAHAIPCWIRGGAPSVWSWKQESTNQPLRQPLLAGSHCTTAITAIVIPRDSANELSYRLWGVWAGLPASLLPIETTTTTTTRTEGWLLANHFHNAISFV